MEQSSMHEVLQKSFGLNMVRTSSQNMRNEDELEHDTLRVTGEVHKYNRNQYYDIEKPKTAALSQSRSKDNQSHATRQFKIMDHLERRRQGSCPRSAASISASDIYGLKEHIAPGNVSLAKKGPFQEGKDTDSTAYPAEGSKASASLK